MRVLITGCGRSGTLYVVEALGQVGLRFGHEVFGADGVVDWHGLTDASLYDVILHQVREPLKTIGSCHTCAPYSWDFICQHEPRILPSDSLILKCMKYWLFWNEQAEKVARWTYRVEDFGNQIGRILALFGRIVDPVLLTKINAINKQTHTRKGAGNYKMVTLKDLRCADEKLAGQIINKAKTYGYGNWMINNGGSL